MKDEMRQFLSLFYTLWEAGREWEQDGTIFVPPSWEKTRPDNFWQLNIKDLILKNVTCKCKQRTQKLADNSIKYINHKFFYIEMTSFLLQWSLFSVITLYFCAYFKQSNILNKNAERWNYAMVGQLTY